MKMRNKGKVHPSPCSSSSSSSVCSNNDAATFSVLKLLPAAILTIISVLSGEDREVLAYMITRSMKATNPSSLFLDEKNRKNSKKQHSNSNNVHKSPLFDCECFECYTSYWVRWDSSPNRELIHQAIEAFEEHLSMGEKSKKGKNKKKDKMGRRGIEERLDFSVPKPTLVMNESSSSPEIQETVSVSEETSSRNEEAVVETGESSQLPKDEEEEKQQEMAEAVVVDEQPGEKKAVVVSGAGSSNHKGLARKVLPDVLGLLNSRLWSLWSPNV